MTSSSPRASPPTTDADHIGCERSPGTAVSPPRATDIFGSALREVYIASLRLAGMHWRGHVGLGLLVCSPLVAWLLALDRVGMAAAVVATAALFGMLPDADEFLPIPHRGLTHTVWFAVGTPLVFGVVAAIVLRVDPIAIVDRPATATIALTGTAALSLLSHLLGDVVTPMGLRPFAPLSDWHVTFDVVLSRSPTVNRLLLGAGLLAVVTSIVLF